MKFNVERIIDKIQVPIVRICNRSCPECCARYELTWYNKDILNKEREVSIEELRWAGNLFGKLNYMEITGGEPTLHSQFEEISNNIHNIFSCDSIMLVTNGWLFGHDPSKLPLLLKYEKIWFSYYTEQFVKNHGGKTNQKEYELVSKFLKENGQPNWEPIIINCHTLFEDPPYADKPCGYNTEKTSNMIAYYEKKLYGCCVSWSIQYKGNPIPLTIDWRDHLGEIDLPCMQCFISGKAK
jgi:hypothetical protein